jgi:acyl carrier protein
MDNLSKIKKIVGEQLDVDPATMTEQSRFIEDLGADSLAIVEVVLAFEAEFNIQISDEVTAKMATIGDVFSYVQKNAA